MPEAQTAGTAEWDRLRKSGCWDESKVREWDAAATEARIKGITTHVGRVFEICVEKGAELPKGNPARKFKGRVVAQGNQVKDENWDVALFSDLSSSPSTMEAAKAVDADGPISGHAVQQSMLNKNTPGASWAERPPGFAFQGKGGLLPEKG